MDLNIFYLYNSGFTIELGADAIIIDYYRGSLSRPWKMPLDKRPCGYRGVYVLASHAHGDHYSREIFNWLSECRSIHYILSDDIRQAVPATIAKAAASLAKAAADPAGGDGCASHTIDFMNPGGSVRVGGFCIQAFGSTDAGVSFYITAEDGTSIFHAGDLNFWHWRDESTAAEVEEADRLFTHELDIIKKAVSKLDAAFFPVDPRMGSDYYRGAVRFCEALRPALLVPMHFSSTFAPPPEFFAEIAQYAKVARVGPKPGRIII